MRQALPLILLLTTLNSAHAEVRHDHEHENESRQMDAHVHGEARLQIAQDGEHLELVFSSPAMNIVGFEHEPRTEADHHKVETAVKELAHADELFVFPAAARCEFEKTEIHSALLKDTEHHEEHDDHKEHADHDDHDDHDDHKEHADHDAAGETHSEFEAHYAVHCHKPKKLDEMTVNLQKVFGAIEHLEVQFLMDQAQGVKTLQAGHTQLHF